MEPKKIDFGSKPKPAPTVASVAPQVQPMPIASAAMTTPPAPVAPPVTRVHEAPIKRLTLTEVNAYGAASMKKMGDVNEHILKFAKGSMLDEAGAGLGQLLVAAQQYDPKNLGKTGGLIFKAKLTFQKLRNNFDSVHSQVEQLSKKVDGTVQNLHRQIGDLERLFEGAKTNYAELEAEIVALEARIAEDEAYPPAVDHSDPFSATEFQAWQTLIVTAKGRVEDMKRMKMTAAQNGAIIKMMGSNSSALIQRFSGVTSFTIPQLKTTFVMMVENMMQKQAVELDKSIMEMNSKATRANAKLLGENTVAIQTQLATSIVKMEDLQFTNDAIIKAVEDTKRIQGEMKTRIENERPQLEAMEQQLRTLQSTRN